MISKAAILICNLWPHVLFGREWASALCFWRGVRALPFGKQGLSAGFSQLPTTERRSVDGGWMDDGWLPANQGSLSLEHLSASKKDQLIYNENCAPCSTTFFCAEPVKKQEPHEQKAFTIVTSCLLVFFRRFLKKKRVFFRQLQFVKPRNLKIKPVSKTGGDRVYVKTWKSEKSVDFWFKT
jgi:hypothetical protein